MRLTVKYITIEWKNLSLSVSYYETWSYINLKRGPKRCSQQYICSQHEIRSFYVDKQVVGLSFFGYALQPDL